MKRFVVPLLVLGLASSAGASDRELQKEIEELKRRVAQLERLLKERQGSEAELQREVSQIKEKLKAIEFGGNAVFYYQGAKLNKLNGVKVKEPSGAGYIANLELTVKAAGGELYSRLHAGEGEGADGNGIGDSLFANLNTLADDNPGDDTFRLLEFYYSKEFLNGKLTLYFGKTEPFILIDANEFANDEVSQFVGKPFVNNPIIDPEDRFAPMVAFDYSISDSFSLQGVAQSNDRGALYFDGSFWTNREKSPYSDIFDYPTLAFQLTYSTNGGNYRVYLWNDRAPHPVIDQPLNDPKRKPDAVRGYVVGLSFDQNLTDRLSLFGRAAYGRPTAYPDSQFYSLGINLRAPFLSRPNDTFAFGTAAVLPSPFAKRKAAELHFETYYKFEVSPNLHLTPDFQYVLNPGGSSDNDPIFAGALKVELSF